MTTANAHTGSSFREGGRCRAAACHGSTCGREAAATGSTAFTTDGYGYVSQGFLYAPFGEIIDEYIGIVTLSALPKYTFNAKELDEETGMYYYEARYMNPPTFISRDPMFEKYFWMSPYAYCANNPLKYVDPTGMEIGDPLKIMKVRRMSVSNTFGNVRHNSDGSHRVHQGIDYYAEEGTPIYAVKSGKIAALGKQGDYGMTITLEFAQEDGTMAYAFYAHLSSYNVEIGQNVEEGDEIGKTGNTGNASNLKGDDQHLHFEYRLQKNLGRGLTGRDDPNKIVDTKFVVDPKNPSKVIRYIDLLLRNAAPCIPAISNTEQWINNIRKGIIEILEQ